MPTLKIQKADGTFEFLQLAGEEFADIGNQVLDVKSQLAQTETDLVQREINVLSPPVPFLAVKGDEIADDSDAMQAIIDYARSINVRVYIPAKTYRLTKSLVILGGTKIRGTLESRLQFEHTSGFSLELRGAYIHLESLRVIGNKNLTFMRLNGTQNVDTAVVDSIFMNVRAENFKLALSTSYSWDNLFLSCRFHNVDKLAEFGNMTNQTTFDNCRFSTYKTGFDFINTELITFTKCDIVGFTSDPANNVINSLFQSHVKFDMCYVEHVTRIGRYGSANEVSGSSLTIDGGIILGAQNSLEITIQTKARGRLSINNVVCNSVKLHRPTDLLFVPLLTNSHIQSQTNQLIRKYDGDVAIDTVFTKRFGGDALLTEIHNGFARIKPAPWNGIRLSTTLEVGQEYTIMLIYRDSLGAFTFSVIGGDNTRLLPSSDFTQVSIPFVASNSTLDLIERAGASGRHIDIAAIRLYKGVNVKDMRHLIDERVMSEVVQ